MKLKVQMTKPFLDGIYRMHRIKKRTKTKTTEYTENAEKKLY
jgi:hypothetical protein